MPVETLLRSALGGNSGPSDTQRGNFPEDAPAKPETPETPEVPNLADIIRQQFGPPKPSENSQEEEGQKAPATMLEALRIHDPEQAAKLLNSMNPLQGVELPEEFQPLGPVLDRAMKGMAYQLMHVMAQGIDPYIAERNKQSAFGEQQVRDIVSRTMDMRSIENSASDVMKRFEATGLKPILMAGLESQYGKMTPEQMQQAIQTYAEMLQPSAPAQSGPQSGRGSDWLPPEFRNKAS